MPKGTPRTDEERLRRHFGADWKKKKITDLPKRGSGLLKEAYESGVSSAIEKLGGQAEAALSAGLGLPLFPTQPGWAALAASRGRGKETALGTAAGMGIGGTAGGALGLGGLMLLDMIARRKKIPVGSSLKQRLSDHWRNIKNIAPIAGLGGTGIGASIGAPVCAWYGHGPDRRK